MKNLATQEARLDYLLQKFKEDSVQYKDLEVEGGYENKRMALRSLMNIRMPGEMANDNKLNHAVKAKTITMAA